MRDVHSYCSQTQQRFWEVSLDVLIAHAQRADRAMRFLSSVKADGAPSLYFIWRGGACKICAPRNGQIFRRGVDPEPPAHVGCRCYAEPYRGEMAQMNDTTTWPAPPKEGVYEEGLPSRTKPRVRGEKSLYDDDGGEWRYDSGDKYHNPHWNYKPSGKAQEWQNVIIGNLPHLK